MITTRKDIKGSKYYPLLKINGNGKFIVLFTAPNCGVIVHNGEGSAHSELKYRDNWVESSFKVYEGSVTLEN